MSAICICGTERPIVIWRDSAYSLFYCAHCSLMWVDPIPDQAQLNALYSPHYFNNYYQRASDSRSRYFRRWLDHLSEQRKPGRLLDVGCGIGLFLRVARERGWDICGVEPSLAAQTFNRDDLRILSGTLESVSLPSHRFDLITLWDVLAHVRKPLQLLTKVHELLAENGAILVKTPNRTYIDVAIARALNLLRGGRGWLHIPAQLFHFSRQSLVELLSRAGFEIFEIHSTNEPFLLGPLRASGSPKILGGHILRLLLRALRRESIIVLAVSHRTPRRFASLAQA